LDPEGASRAMIRGPFILAALLLLASGSFTPRTLAQGGGEDSDVSITRNMENAILAVP
jgi:hypothetical protein